MFLYNLKMVFFYSDCNVLLNYCINVGVCKMLILITNQTFWIDNAGTASKNSNNDFFVRFFPFVKND